ncbi:hypothetical protein JAAARDRAFT_140537 [Jaapia argillacea MUCL 33604]|uniref:FAD-binding FR-type domain-containing protein n=1 Tax=Jaapia argillacea MUCL 33604 TaxID=933084 RepID=A0A067PBN2_9AGAM|nr:hypothetical protein JAAARDRAFT_140537 [Jaapia argillacea MUCL 33604]
MPTELRGWHRGEYAIQRKLGYDGVMSQGYQWIECEMPEQHRQFYARNLPFVPITTLDEKGRPWSSIVGSSSGEVGFMKSPNETRLQMDVDLWEGDPLLDNVELFGKEKMLVAGIGVEFPTRRRNKFAGSVTKLERKGHSFHLDLHVNQAIGNCPKYINIRDLVPHPQTSPNTVYRKTDLSDADRLPQDVIDFIHESDTVFLGTSYKALPQDQTKFPSHVGMNQRAGRPGFIRVRPSDGRTVVLPDYSGNRIMTSLGNIEATPLASLSFINFTTGDVLYLTGSAMTIIGPEAQRIMPRQNVITSIFITGYILILDALPVRQRPGTTPHRSPYSPPVRHLAEETSPNSSAYFDNDVFATLSSIKILSDTLGRFTWETSEDIQITPGQTAILDFTDFVGPRQYQHMAAYNPTSVNDDRIRTWTISSAHKAQGTRTFDITMREKPGGLVTGALFNIARKLQQNRPELLDDLSPLQLRARLVGISGEFVLPDEPSEGKEQFLWIAGGIGITPFLSMLRHIVSQPDEIERDIALVISTREPRVFVDLLMHALEGELPNHLHLSIDIFSNEPIPDLVLGTTPDPNVVVQKHAGRITQSYLRSFADVGNRVTYLCGPEEFESAVVEALGSSVLGAIKREGFSY